MDTSFSSIEFSPFENFEFMRKTKLEKNVISAEVDDFSLTVSGVQKR